MTAAVQGRDGAEIFAALLEPLPEGVFLDTTTIVTFHGPDY